MPSISRAEEPPMTLENLIARLEEDIVLARRKPRERLIEEDLVAQFDVKKHVVRRALAELEQMGLAERKRNRGAVVRDYTPEEVRQIYAVRELLETQAAEQIPLPASAELVAALSDIQKVHGDGIDSGDIVGAFRANVHFHQTLFAACGNPYLAAAINQFALKSHGVRFYSLVRADYMNRAREDHEAMIEALRVGDRDRLVALCRAHLTPSAQAYIDASQPMVPAASHKAI